MYRTVQLSFCCDWVELLTLETIGLSICHMSRTSVAGFVIEIFMPGIATYSGLNLGVVLTPKLSFSDYPSIVMIVFIIIGEHHFDHEHISEHLVCLVRILVKTIHISFF